MVASTVPPPVLLRLQPLNERHLVLLVAVCRLLRRSGRLAVRVDDQAEGGEERHVEQVRRGRGSGAG